MIRQINPYSPCFCKSGRKFKFCCLGKPADIDDVPSREEDRWLFFAKRAVYMINKRDFPLFLEEAIDRAAEFSAESTGSLKVGHDIEEAKRLLYQSLEAFPPYTPAYNNLAGIHYLEGRTETAHAICSFIDGYLEEDNPFTISSLVNFSLALDDEKSAVRYANRLTRLEFPDISHAIHACDAFARLHRHKDVLSVASQLLFEDSRLKKDFEYFTAVALMNLGQFDGVSKLLERHDRGFAREFSQLLKEKRSPGTYFCTWPYHEPAEWLPEFKRGYMESKPDHTKEMKFPGCPKYWLDSLHSLDDDIFEESLSLIAKSRFVGSKELFKSIAVTPVRSDRVRMKALYALRENDLLSDDEPVEVLIGGKLKTVSIELGELPDYYGDEASGRIREEVMGLMGRKKYKQALNKIIRFMASNKESPPVLQLAVVCHLYMKQKKPAFELIERIKKKYPDYPYPYLVEAEVALSEGKLVEAESSLRKLDKMPFFSEDLQIKKSVIWVKLLTEKKRRKMITEDAFEEEMTRYMDFLAGLDDDKLAGTGLEGYMNIIKPLIGLRKMMIESRERRLNKLLSSARNRVYDRTPGLADSLSELTVTELQSIARTAGARCPGGVKKDIISKVARLITEERSLGKIVDSLGDTARLGLKTLCDNGFVMGDRDFIRLLREKKSDKIRRSPLEELLYTGIVSLATVKDKHVAFVPDELRSLLKKIVTATIFFSTPL